MRSLFLNKYPRQWIMDILKRFGQWIPWGVCSSTNIQEDHLVFMPLAVWPRQEFSLPLGHLHWKGGTDTRKESPNSYRKLLRVRGCTCVQTNAACKSERCSTIQKSSVIYECKYDCDSRYVGRTSQRLQDRIKQHVTKWLRHTASSECNLTECVSENNPLQNVTQQLDNTH